MEKSHGDRPNDSSRHQPNGNTHLSQWPMATDSPQQVSDIASQKRQLQKQDFTPREVEALQRTIGNQATLRVHGGLGLAGRPRGV